MNWSKGFLIFSLFVLGISVIYFVVTSYQMRHLVEQEVALAPYGEKVSEINVHRRYVSSANTDQSNQENHPVENEDDSDTASDVSVDSILDSLTDDFELEQGKEAIADALSPELKLKAERYAKLAEILPVIAELRYQNFKLAKQNEKYIEEHYRRLRLQGGPYPEPDPAVEEEFQKAKKILDQKENEYNRQIDNIFPELSLTYQEQGEYRMWLFIDERILREYFGKKLPYDGNPDYFSSD